VTRVIVGLPFHPPRSASAARVQLSPDVIPQLVVEQRIFRQIKCLQSGAGQAERPPADRSLVRLARTCHRAWSSTRWVTRRRTLLSPKSAAWRAPLSDAAEDASSRLIQQAVEMPAPKPGPALCDRIVRQARRSGDHCVASAACALDHGTRARVERAGGVPNAQDFTERQNDRPLDGAR
jgi:hypothetical protein